MSKDTWISLVILVAALAVFGPVLWDHFRRANVVSHGISAQAKILEIFDTGRRNNTNPVVRIKLMVKDANGQEFPAEVTQPMSPVRLPQYQPGAVVPVKYDPRSRDRVALDLGQTDGK